jgi:actin-related protein
MYKTIVLGGGMTNLFGFEKKLIKELRELNQKFFEIKTKLSENPELNAWKGGSILSDTRIEWYNQHDYKEFGSEKIKKIN